jgi:hypothetical protein
LPIVAAFAGSFSRSNRLRRLDGSTTSSSASLARCPGVIRPATVANTSRFTSARILATIRSSVVYPGSSRPDPSNSSNATLIRSAGLSFVTAAARIAVSAMPRTSAASYFTPRRSRT